MNIFLAHCEFLALYSGRKKRAALLLTETAHKIYKFFLVSILLPSAAEV